MKEYILAGILALTSGRVLAGGGKKGQPDLSPVEVPSESCVVIVPPGVDLETCTISPSSPQSGLQAWICPADNVVVCDAVVEDEKS